MEGDNSQTQTHSEIPGGRIIVFRLGQGKLCFSGLQVESQFLSLSFYHHSSEWGVAKETTINISVRVSLSTDVNISINLENYKNKSLK